MRARRGLRAVCSQALDFMVRMRQLDVVDDATTRILMCNEDCPARKFADWRAQSATARAEEFEASWDGAGVAPLFFARRAGFVDGSAARSESDV